MEDIRLGVNNRLSTLESAIISCLRGVEWGMEGRQMRRGGARDRVGRGKEME